MSSHSANIDFDRLWAQVESEFRGSLYGIHGRKHWKQVERNGILLAENNGLNPEEIILVRLFAILHDSQRINDNWDKGHGLRAADYARQIYGTFFTLPASLLKKLEDACARHELGETTLDPLIGTCWDADRLDLVRIGATPQIELMSTPAGRELAQKGWR